MQFKKYPKIHRLGKDEVDGILVGQCYIQEKIDGANTSIWVGDGGELRFGSRNNDVTKADFRGFPKYVHNHEGIKQLLMENPEYRLYGEWCVKHTISYKATSYDKFYLFDIEFGDKRLTLDEVYSIANNHNIETPQLFGLIENPSLDDIKQFVGKSNLGAIGEGVVIKNFDFINNFGDMTYAKVVTEKFKEDNAITFGGNNKHSDSYWETYIMNKYVTLARVEKIIKKLSPEINESLDMKHIPRIIGTVYHDMVTEEIWEIQKKAQNINFKVLQRLCYKKAKQIYVDILEQDISVADKKDE